MIYTIALISISEMRDSKISAIFGEEVFNGNWQYVWTSNNRLLQSVSLRCKTYKTLSGATKAAKILNLKRDGTNLRLQIGHWDQNRRNWINSVEFKSSVNKFVPIEITENWNKMIDDLIQKKKNEFELEVKKLKEKKDEKQNKPVLDLVR